MKRSLDLDDPRVYSYGGGVQSTAMLVLVATGHLPPGPFLFSNVGDDSEHPATLRYVREVAFDYAAAHGIEIHELHREPVRGPLVGTIDTLWGRLMQPGSRSLPIPVRMPDTGAPGTRACTGDYKIRVVQRWLREHGATEANPWKTAIGISTDEHHRATSRKRLPFEVLEYPLLTLEHRLAPRGANRDQCAAIIRDAGIPVPRKSSCFFCPFHKPEDWNDQARDEPELFEKSCQLEETLIERRSTLECKGRTCCGPCHVEGGHITSQGRDPTRHPIHRSTARRRGNSAHADRNHRRPPMSRYTINVHANGQDPLPIGVLVCKGFISLRIGEVSFFLDDLATAADLSERISVAVSAAMAAPDPSTRLRSCPVSERIAEMSASEWEAQR